MVNQNNDDDYRFVACLKSEVTKLFIDTWDPTYKDLATYSHIVFTYSKEWNTHPLYFTSMEKIEWEKI